MSDRLIFLDTETTGMTRDDRVIELGMVEVIGGRLTGNRFHSYIWTDRPIHWAASKVHGIRNRDLTGKPRFEALAPAILRFIDGSPAFAHNAAFDGRMMDTEWEAAGVPRELRPRLTCTIRLASPVTPGGAKLDQVMRHFLPDMPPRGNHSAVEDAEILARAFIEIGNRHPEHMKLFMADGPRPVRRAPTQPSLLSITNPDKPAATQRPGRAVPGQDTLSPEIVTRIHAVNASGSVEDAMGLRTGRDGFSALKEKDMRPVLGEAALIVLDDVTDPRMRAAAMRMTLRGLQASLAVERERKLAEMYEQRPEPPLSY